MPLDDLSERELWRSRLGVLPVPIMPGDDHRFVMLNGVSGNFCLDASGEPPTNPRSLAWSANVGHYLYLEGNMVVVHQWDRAKAETLPSDIVGMKMERFQRVLEANEPQYANSVVRHVVRVMDRLRSELNEPESALNALLVLFACIDAKTDLAHLDRDRYGLSNDAIVASTKIPAPRWQRFEMDLRKPEIPDITLDVAVALRHCAGQLFQEAHWKATELDQQISLFDDLPRPARVLKGSSDDLGVYFTPLSIARTVVERAITDLDFSQPTIQVFDPACGSGEFLAEAARQLRESGYTGVIALRGHDSSRRAASMANFVLRAQFPSDLYEVRIDVIDSLDEGCVWPSKPDLLFMNPPFVSWWDMASGHRERVREIVGTNMKSKADYSAAFLVKALESNPKRLGVVLKTSCLDNDNFSAIRRSLRQRYGLELIARLGNLSLFRTAMIDSCLLVARRGDVYEPTTMLWTDQRPGSVSSGLRALRRGRSAWSGNGYDIYAEEIGLESGNWSPRPSRSRRFLEANEGLPRVTDLFDVHQGVITGLNAAFVLPKDVHSALPAAERKLFRPAVLNSTIRDGRLSVTHYVWNPYKHGLPLFNTWKEVAARAPQYFATYLKPNESALQKRRGMSNAWWQLIWPRLDRVGPKIVTTYYGGRGSFAFDEADEFAVVQGYSWHPKQSKDIDRKLLFPEVAFAYIAVLNTDAFATALMGHARIVAGGQLDLSIRFLKSTPLPDLYEGLSPDIIGALIAFGRAMSSGDQYDRNQLERIVRSLYGLDGHGETV